MQQWSQSITGGHRSILTLLFMMIATAFSAGYDHPSPLSISQLEWTYLNVSSAGGNIVHFMGCRAAENENDLSPIKAWQEAYVEKLKEMGKDVTVKKYVGACHAFYLFSSDLTDKAMRKVYDFINSHKTQ
ncbi:unnamed protein product [Calypogeia fissa]